MNHFNIKNCLFFLFFLLSIQGKAQLGFNNDDFPEKKGAFYSGGTLNLMFGSVTYIDIAPHFGTYITDRISLAGGITYAYYSEKAYNYNTYIYGGRVFGRFDLFRQLFVHAEMEALNIQNHDLFLQNAKRTWLFSPLVGIGYRQMYSDLSGTYLMLLWNFDETLSYPYGNPMLRFGFEFGWEGKKSSRK